VESSKKGRDGGRKGTVSLASLTKEKLLEYSEGGKSPRRKGTKDGVGCGFLRQSKMGVPRERVLTHNLSKSYEEGGKEGRARAGTNKERENDSSVAGSDFLQSTTSLGETQHNNLGGE